MTKPNNYHIELTPSEASVVREAIKAHEIILRLNPEENNFEIQRLRTVDAKLIVAIANEICERRGIE